jgi:hypothetical protein
MHDYANPSWKGIKQAVDEYFSGTLERPVILGDKSGTAMVRKSVNAPSLEGAISSSQIPREPE